MDSKLPGASERAEKAGSGKTQPFLLSPRIARARGPREYQLMYLASSVVWE
jgi:hypothetical protein